MIEMIEDYQLDVLGEEEEEHSQGSEESKEGTNPTTPNSTPTMMRKE